jgi:hypothetical protein
MMRRRTRTRMMINKFGDFLYGAYLALPVMMMMMRRRRRRTRMRTMMMINELGNLYSAYPALPGGSRR